MTIHLKGNARQRRKLRRRIVRALREDEHLEQHTMGQFTSDMTLGKHALLFYIKP